MKKWGDYISEKKKCDYCPVLEILKEVFRSLDEERRTRIREEIERWERDPWP